MTALGRKIRGRCLAFRQAAHNVVVTSNWQLPHSPCLILTALGMKIWGQFGWRCQASTSELPSNPRLAQVSFILMASSETRCPTLPWTASRCFQLRVLPFGRRIQPIQVCGAIGSLRTAFFVQMLVVCLPQCQGGT